MSCNLKMNTNENPELGNAATAEGETLSASTTPSPEQLEQLGALRRSPRARKLTSRFSGDGQPNLGRASPISINETKRKTRQNGRIRGKKSNKNTAAEVIGEETPKPNKKPRKRSRRVGRTAKTEFQTTSNSVQTSAMSPDESPQRVTAETSAEKPKRKRRTPYSKKTWQEQMELLDQEAERARKEEEQEQKRLRRLPPLGKLPNSKLEQLRPKAPRNTTQFLIDSHASDDDSVDDDAIQIDEHGTMAPLSGELLALRDELRDSHNLVT